MSHIVECIVEPKKMHVSDKFTIKLKIHETEYYTLGDWKDSTMDEIKDKTLHEILVKNE